MKRVNLFKFIFVILVISFSAFLFWFPKQEKQTDWVTFKKEGNKTSSTPTTKVDKEKHNLLQTKKSQSFKVLGNNKQVTEQQLTSLYQLKVDSQWINKLGQKLLDGQEEDIKLFIRKIHTIAEVKKSDTTFKEVVTITFSSKNGDQSSFRALIDPITLKVIKKWDRTIVENLIDKPKGLNPSGRY